MYIGIPEILLILFLICMGLLSLYATDYSDPHIRKQKQLKKQRRLKQKKNKKL